jgi:cyclophilin family peptidyl-prolyl cis-trans isomerase
MALVIALGKTKTKRAANTLLYQYNIEQDDRVKINILRALTNVDYQTAKPTVLQALNDPNTAVAKTAAAFFTQNGIAEDASTYWQLAKAPNRTRWEVTTELYAAALKHLPYGFEESRKFLNWELRRLYENSTNPYEKASALRAMSNYGWNYRYIRDAGYPSDYLPVRTAAVEGLANIARMKNFRSFFAGGNRVRKELSDSFRDAIDNGDVGIMAVAAEVLRDPNLSFKSTFDSLEILENALTKLRIPQEIETYNEVQKTLAYFRDTTYTASPPRFTHKIAWKFINDWKENAKVVIQTSRGDIKLALMPEVAPGTVANFLELIQDGFYKGKNFHRVVPNFVIQGGCPRGDGYGSLNYAIRSELSYLHYDAQGYVGMASAGKHTECTQFFITHSPTPHLDGKYTLFAQVVEGLEVVKNVRIGDVIEDITIENPK